MVYIHSLCQATKNILFHKLRCFSMRETFEKGRDLFDVSILLGAAQPDFDYIAGYLGIEEKEIIEQFTKRVEELDLEYLARDVEPFLFSPEQKERVLTFREYWQQHQ